MIWIIIIIIVGLFILFGQGPEYFDPNPYASDNDGAVDWDPLWTGEQSADCYHLSEKDCMEIF